MDLIARSYQAIGEFVVFFQWVENKYREIGWFILDPDRTSWPPRELRRESNVELIDKVTNLYLELTQKYAFPEGASLAEDFARLGGKFHELRRHRNRFVHSTYVDLKAGGELLGHIRSDPRLRVDPDAGEIVCDQEDFTPESIHQVMREFAEPSFRLGQHYLQLICWNPFDRYERAL